jgi:polysaccharide biosynthesis/export protein
MRPSRVFVLAVMALALTGCMRAQQRVVRAAPPPPVVAVPAIPVVAAAPEAPYVLDSGDRLRVIVFGQEGLTNGYAVDPNGTVTLPLIGAVRARGLTGPELAQAIAARLRQGYIREPHVAVEIEAYRPFFILGEVTAPGQYPYVANMTIETAVAIAGGFTPRAFKRHVKISRIVNGVVTRGSAPLAYQIQPGDTINVTERWF